MAINQAQLFDLLTQYRSQNWRGIQTPEWQQKIVRDMVAYDEPGILKGISERWELPADPLILDLGAGVGNFVVGCRKKGLRAFGIEPDRIGRGAGVSSLQIARQRLEPAPFAAAVGEQLPFPDGIFDLVVMDQVIEHVNDQARVVAEAFRVLKPGGALYVACPNYLRFYEPHYKLWFLPLFPKLLASIYLRICGRDPVLLRQITYTTNRRVARLLSTRPCRLLDLNHERLLGKFSAQNHQFASRRARIAHRLGSGRLTSRAMRWAAAEYLRLRAGGCQFLAIKEA